MDHYHCQFQYCHSDRKDLRPHNKVRRIVLFICVLVITRIIATTFPIALFVRNSYNLHIVSALFIFSALLEIWVTWISNTQLVHQSKQYKEIYELYNSFQESQHNRYVEINKLAALGRITTGLIHDIANPLSYVANTLGNETNENQKTTTKHRRIMYAYDGLKEIASIIESTRKQLQTQGNSEYFTPAKEIVRACRFLHYHALKHKVTFQSKLDYSITLRADVAKFHQCVTNVLTNAIQAYSNKDETLKKIGKRKVCIRMKMRKEWIYVCIKDSAGGIRPEHRSHIFTPFFTTKNPQEGTGVGLAMTKDIMENIFLGKISFSTNTYRGTEFTLAFPSMEKQKKIESQHTY